MTRATEALRRLVAAPADRGLRLRYATLLEEEGDSLRSSVVRETARAIETHHVDGLRDRLDALPGAHAGWARLVGARLIGEMLERDLGPFLERWLPLARPALELVMTPGTMPPALGTTRLFGDPDLPRGAKWPTLGDCKRWELFDLDPAARCQFVGQLDLTTLARSAAACAMPDHGLLSVFAHQEREELGSSSACVLHTPDITDLERVPHPVTDEANARVPPHAAELIDALTIPELRGPWASDLGIAENDWSLGDAHREVMLASGGDLAGMLGHLRATTGGDPTPDRSWMRLLCLPLAPDQVVFHHLAIRGSDLGAARLDRFELVWVDFDGA